MKIQFLHPEQNKITVVNLNNFEYLPLFYLFPKELLEDNCPGLVDIPRNVHDIFKQEKWYTMLNSDFFFQAVCDLTAFYVWPAFGISTYMECFSGHDPMWRLAHATYIWEEAFEHLSGVTPYSLTNSAKKEQRWLDTDPLRYVDLKKHLFFDYTLSFMDSLRAMPCHAISPALIRQWRWRALVRIIKYYH